MSDTLLVTKTRLPPLRRDLIRRPHMIQRLNDGFNQNHRLTLVSAPAGYGKSTILSEWVSQLDTPFAWLSLEKGENVPNRFWNYFFTALSTIPHLHRAGIGESLLQALQSPQPPQMDVLLSDLLNDFSKLEIGAILVLDDLHSITESQIHQDLIFLITHLPLSAGGLHLVVASRMDPPWPLARWRARGELTELRSSNLRFSYEETFQLLNQILQLKLSSQDISALQERTEGWIVGLQLASITIQGLLKAQGTQGVSRFIESFTGSNRFVLDYLVEEVIGQQTTEMSDFLHETSILEQFTASLCDAISNRNNSQKILYQVERANLFLIPLDDERQWFRYHHLFAELLSKRLKQMRPDYIAEIHRRASKWYAEKNIYSEAIIHALEAGDIQYVNEFVSGNALAIVEHTELLGVLRHFEEMPEEQVFAKPWVCVAYAWVKAYADPTAGLDSILQHSEQCLTGIENASERQRLTGHFAAIRAYVAWVKGESEQALEFTRQALGDLPEDDWVTRCHVLHTQGSALLYLNHLPEAIQSFEAAIIAGQMTGRPQETFFANTNLAFVYYLSGGLHQSLLVCQQVLNLAEKSEWGFKRSPILAHAYGTMSLVQQEWNEVEAAISSAQEGVTLAEQWNQADALHFTLNCLSKALCAAGNLEKAFAINRRAMQIAENVSAWFYMLSVCNEIDLNLVKGDISAATHRFSEIEPLFDKKSSDTFLNTKAFLLNAQGRISELTITLDEAIEDVRQSGENWLFLRLLSLQALAFQALDRKEEALSRIDHCLALAEPEGYVRIFVERGAPMHRLLQMAASRGIHTGYINRLLPAFKIADTSLRSAIPKTQYMGQGPALLEPISARELQVLRLLNSSLTSKEIGRELYLSANTVRTHIRNIYSKLGVHGRIEAVQKAKEYNLM